jgi:peroxiredoxin
LGSVAPRLRAVGAEPLAVAVTALFSQMAFADSLGIDVPLLSDWDGDVCGAYGVRYDQWKGHTGLAQRSLFVIDGGGMVRYRWHTLDALLLPDLTEVVAAVEALAP